MNPYAYLMQLQNGWKLTPLQTFVLGIFLTHEASFIGFNVLYLSIEGLTTNRWKIQKNSSPPKAMLWDAVKHVYIGRLFFQVPFVIAFYHLWAAMGGTLELPIPPVKRILGELVVILLMTELMFYTLHRLFHTPWLYTSIHKRHHRFVTPSGISSEYAHPIEDIIVNLCSTLLPAAYLGSHAFVLYVWVAIRIWETVDAHSGLALPFSPFHTLPCFGGPLLHDFHHSHPGDKNCFGVLGLLDWALGTDRKYREWLRNGRGASEKFL